MHRQTIATRSLKATCSGQSFGVRGFTNTSFRDEWKQMESIPRSKRSAYASTPQKVTITHVTPEPPQRPRQVLHVYIPQVEVEEEEPTDGSSEEEEVRSYV